MLITQGCANAVGPLWQVIRMKSGSVPLLRRRLGKRRDRGVWRHRRSADQSGSPAL